MSLLERLFVWLGFGRTTENRRVLLYIDSHTGLGYSLNSPQTSSVVTLNSYSLYQQQI